MLKPLVGMLFFYSNIIFCAQSAYALLESEQQTPHTEKQKCSKNISCFWDNCSKTFKSAQEFKEHILTKHGKQQQKR